jgi:hypothetical protein
MAQQGQNGAYLKGDMVFPGGLIIQFSESLKLQHFFTGDFQRWKRWFRGYLHG